MKLVIKYSNLIIRTFKIIKKEVISA